MPVTRHRFIDTLKRYYREVEGLEAGSAASAGWQFAVLKGRQNYSDAEPGE